MKKFKKYIGCLMVAVMALSLTGCAMDSYVDTLEEKIAELETLIMGEPQLVAESGEAIITNDEEQEVVEVQQISQDKYAYSTLDDEAKTVYDEMLYCILSYDETIQVSTLDLDVISQCYEAIMADYGGLFWVDGYTYLKYTQGEEITKLEFQPAYTMTEEEKDAYQEQVDAAVEEYLYGISSTDSDYDKVKYLFDTLLDKVDYNQDADNNQNILSVFLGGETVCQGYASAMQYLCTQLDIPCTIITGQADGTNHAWNMVYMDGAYYMIDVTWGDAAFSLDEEENSFINYAYFCVTDQDMADTHQVTSSFELPECVANEDNYYIHEGLYFSSLDTETLDAIISQYYTNGETLSLKFASSDLYAQFVDYYLTQQKISSCCPGLTQLYYIEQEDSNIININF